MVSTLIAKISTVTVHVLHGESKSVLGAQHGPLTCKRQLHMCTSLDRAQAKASIMWRIMIENTIAHLEPLDQVTKKR